MHSGPSVRVLLFFHPERSVSRETIDWIAERQYSRVLVAGVH